MALPNYPTQLVDYYFQSYGLGKRGTLRSYHNAIRNNGSVSYIENLADHVYENSFKDKASRDDFDKHFGIKDWQETRESLPETIVKGNIQRLKEVGAGGVQVGAKIASLLGADEKEWDDVADDIRGDHKPTTHKSFHDFMYSKDFGDLFAFGGEAFASSAVEWPLMFYAWIPYVVGRTGEIASDRAESDGRDIPSGEDFFFAAPTAVVVSALDKLGAKKIFGIPQNIRKAADFPAVVAAAIGIETATEAVQEGLEYTATTAGTKTGFSTKQLGESMLAGGLVGAVAGGTIRTTTGAGQLATGRHPASEDDPINKIFIDTLDNGLPNVESEKVKTGVQKVDMNRVKEAVEKFSDAENNDIKGENKIGFVLGLASTLAKKIGVKPDIEFTEAVSEAYDAVEADVNPEGSVNNFRKAEAEAKAQHGPEQPEGATPGTPPTKDMELHVGQPWLKKTYPTQPWAPPGTPPTPPGTPPTPPGAPPGAHPRHPRHPVHHLRHQALRPWVQMEGNHHHKDHHLKVQQVR